MDRANHVSIESSENGGGVHTVNHAKVSTGPKGDKVSQKKAFKLAWFKSFGFKEEDEWRHRCQSCGQSLRLGAADFSHKVPAGRGGDKGGEVQASNGIASCRLCHNWLEGFEEARQAVMRDGASLENDLLVEWPENLWRSLIKWHLQIAGRFNRPSRST